MQIIQVELTDRFSLETFPTHIEIILTEVVPNNFLLPRNERNLAFRQSTYLF